MSTALNSVLNKSRHFLTGQELSRSELQNLLRKAIELKALRVQNQVSDALKNKTVALLFDKPSMRTRVSFTVAVQELGGSVVELNSSLRKHEEPEDTARVLSGFCHSVMYRTFAHTILERMATQMRVPLINGLSDAHHPCQALADLQTLSENFGKLEGLTMTYIGDGNNVLHSLMLLAPYMGVNLRYACPQGYAPNGFIAKKAARRAREGGGSIQSFSDPRRAAQGAHALYTDVWTSMGFEDGESEREQAFANYQIDDAVLGEASPEAIVLHCMPMVRGKEIAASVADGPASRIFQQSENRLHAQKALLVHLLA